MKKLVHRILLFVVFTAIGQLLKAQNIGVNNNNPATSLDVNGAIATREGAALALSAGANNNINISTFGFFRITGPTAPFNLTGFNGGANGRLLIVINNTSQPMTIKANDAGSTTTNQIQTPNGQDLAIPPSGTATLQYNATNSKWYVIASQAEPNYWTLSGPSLYNNAGTNVGIGLTAPTNKLHVSGVNPVRIETLSGGTTTDSVMTIDPTGVVRRRSVSSIATQILGGFTANNGLTKTGTNIKIGGTLIENTNIDLGAFNFTLTSGSTGQVGIGTNTPTNKLHILDASNPLRLEGLVGGAAADSIVTANGTGVIRRRTLSDVLAGGNTTFWRTVGNAGTNPATNFIGTTDAQALVFKTSGAETGRFMAGGNLALGNTVGSNKLHVTAASNPVRFEGISGGAIADSLVTTDATGVLRKRTVASVVGGAITADNGLTKNTANNVRLGGTLLQNTTVAQGAFTMSFDGTSNLGMGNAAPSNRLHVTAASNPVRFEGLAAGAIADSLVTTDATGVLRKRTVASVVGNAFTANNGLTKTGNNVEFGGALIKNTDVAQGAFNVTFTGAGDVGFGTAAPTNKVHINETNPIRLEGLQSGNSADSIMTVNATGVVRRRPLSDVLSGAQITVNNGLTKTGQNIQMGGALIQATTIAQAGFDILHTGAGNFSLGNAAPTNKLHVTAVSNPVRFEGIVGGAVADSLLTADATGVVRRRTVASVVGGAFTADNGLTKNTANNVRLGGTLLQNTTVSQGAFTMSFDGTSNLGMGNTAPSNRLHVTAASNPVRFEGISAGAIADSIVTADATGVLRRRTVASVVGNAFTANNGLTKNANNVEMGGTLLKNTDIAMAGFNITHSGAGNVSVGNAAPSNRLHVTAASNPVRFEGIAGGAIADSLVTTDATGVLRKRTVASVVGGAITADNGLTKNTANNVRLGGTLLQNTTIDQSTFNMVYSGTGNFGIGTASPAQKLDVTGNIAVAGNIFTSSDIRFKKNVTTLSGSLDKLMKLRGTEYDWKIKEFPAKNFDNRHQIGFIAQELEKVFPELVTTGKDGYKSVDYTHIVPVLVEAMKEQQKMIEQLKSENSTLTASKTQNDKKVEDLSKQMSALTDMVKSLLSKETSSTKIMSEK